VSIEGRASSEGGLRTLAASLANPLKRSRPTLHTRFDLPEGTDVPRDRRRRFALGVGAGFLLAALTGFAVFEWRGRHVAEAEPASEPEPAERVKTLYKDNGEMIVKARVPDPLSANHEMHAHLEIKNKLGQPVVADEIVLTIADATGAAKGLTARRHDATVANGEYFFRYTFPAPGTYVLRVFPPSIDSSFEIPIDVK
jgi:hypothetical protein